MTYLRSFRRMILAALVFLTLSAAAGAADKPNLVLVSVGVSKFQHRPFERGVVAAAKDALDVSRAYREQEGKLFGKIEGRMLVDEQATCANIVAALAWALKQAKPDGYVIIFMASHAGPDALGQYSFTPHDANPFIPSTMLTSKTLRKHLDGIPGKCLVILDTCHSGGFGRLGGVSYVTLAACSHQEVSDEHSDRKTGNGFFTRAFIEAIRGKADLNRDGAVTLAELESYVGDRLNVISKGRQRFTVNAPTGFERTLAIAKVDAGMLAGR